MDIWPARAPGPWTMETKDGRDRGYRSLGPCCRGREHRAELWTAASIRAESMRGRRSAGLESGRPTADELSSVHAAASAL